MPSKEIKTLCDLAVFGAQPTFCEKLFVGNPNIGNRDSFINRMNDMLDRQWLTNNGPYVQELEDKLAKRIGVKHCITASSGTIALEIAIRALKLSGEVILPSFTFIATAHALQWQNITPVFCDIDPQTHNIDPQQIEKLITDKTTGLIGVHLWGRACDVEQLTQIARKHNLKLLFDAAHAFGCSYQGKTIGSFGDAEVFSFHATKSFHTVEGGAIVTNNDALAKQLRLMSNLGFDGYDHVSSIGINGKMNECCAAMGLNQLEQIDDILEINRLNYQRYKEGLCNIPGVKFINYDQEEKCSYQHSVVEIDQNATFLSRDEFVTLLHAENVLARKYFYPGCHKMEPYQSEPRNAALKLPNSDALSASILSLPIGISLTPQDIQTICTLIRFLATHGPEIQKKLNKTR